MGRGAGDEGHETRLMRGAGEEMERGAADDRVALAPATPAAAVAIDVPAVVAAFISRWVPM